MAKRVSESENVRQVGQRMNCLRGKGRKYTFVSVSRGLFTGAWISLLLSLPGTLIAAAPDKGIQLSVARPEGEPFRFGEIAEAEFRLKNTSDQILLVTQLSPVSNPAEEPVNLSSGVYGAVRKLEDSDRYEFNRMAQTMTRMAFHGGLLFPGQEVIVVAPYRPLATTEEFRVDFHVLGGPASELKIYVLDSRDMLDSPGPRRSWQRFVPFSLERWQELCATCGRIRALGPSSSPRAVLIPDLKAPPSSTVRRVDISFEGAPFTLEKAQKAVKHLADGAKATILGYSQVLGGYFVVEPAGAWLLSAPEQSERGRFYPPIPPQLLKDADTKSTLEVRIGDKQEGFGPETKQQEGRKFWERYDVYYGDGMYTRGEFLRIASKELPGFLSDLREHNATLGIHYYYFRSRYYVLEIPAGSNVQSENPHAQ